MDYVIGMDGGGTKTEVLVAGLNRDILFHYQGGALNYNGGDKALIDSGLQGIFKALVTEGFLPERCLGICIGAAGTSNPSVRKYILEQVLKSGYQCRVCVVGDMDTAFAGALNNSPGIILIAGTGSICYGKDPLGSVCRSGGYGHIIGDEGSGYMIAHDILTAIVKAQDKRGEPTLLTGLVFRCLDISSIEELIGYLYAPGRTKKEIAQLSVLIKAAYDSGDTVAIQIVKKCASELIQLAEPIIRQMGNPSELAVSGSVLLKNDDIYREFEIHMKERFPGTEIIKPYHDAAYGAVLIALSDYDKII